MGFTLELFDTPELFPVIQECLRILKPGGQMGIVTMSVSNSLDLPSGFIRRRMHAGHDSWIAARSTRLSLLVNSGIFLQEDDFQ